MKNTLTLLLFYLLGILFPYAQTKVYVSSGGSDSNPGTLAKPFKTPERAVQEIEKANGKSLIIYLRKGIYYLQQPIVLDNKNLKTKSLLISSYPGEQAFISAGQLLKTDWKPYKNGIYVTPIPQDISFERLYANEKLQILARYPDYDPNARVFNGTSADAIAPERMKQWKNPAGGYVHGLHSGEWGGFHYRIAEADEKGNLKLEGGWQNNRPSPLHKQFRFVENIFEELNAPGEWFADKEKGLLYYYPPKGTNLSQTDITVSRLKNSIEIKGTEGLPLSGVEIKSIGFLHNERSFMDTKEPLLRSDWTIYRVGVIFMENTRNIKVTDCQFTDVGGNAIMLSGYNKNNTISGNHISGAGASGIAFVGETDAVRSPSFRYEDYVPYDKLDKIPGPKSNHYPQQCIAENNLIHDIGKIEKQATGIQIDIAANITVRHNSIYNTPRAGINIGDGAFGGHILEFNDVFNTVLETGDHGAFNSWGRDRFWSPDRKYMDSITTAHHELILLDAQQTTIIRNNRFRCDHGWDVDLDDGSSNYHIYNNVMLNGGLKFREGFKRKAENNIMINNSFHPHVWFKNSDDYFTHNIVMTPYAPIGVNDWGKNIDYNLFPDAKALQAAQKRNTDQHSISGNPDFINPQIGDYRVKSNSPALRISFKNFPMDQFGVQIPRLKQMAARPELPKLISSNENNKSIASIDFLNATIKSVEGLGERSAFGLPDENGGIIVKLDSNSPLKKAGLQEKDVIRMMDGTEIKKASDLLNVYQSSKWKGQVKVEVMRNQQTLQVNLLLK
ncbi:PDZ domain-containing protein [Elizabethkingia anophelis]|uniref:PDZ domain-containing protein n=1 Tax=Elizabethkingia anophelis TaxID=1117645 RepID=UPI000C9D1FC9|nr:PDZ domain-containing protein [Elizabethkingia anophelis]MCT3760522.1 PDZ domain-containing protein [Elizabethkingia anophelis]MCT3975212.1 PDZ domain-containing protein [Elizabethkingia anophelis]MCT4003681.1 PDZ domain-containing protein [Elizabethkingia anophelis]MCT4017773.1 PDZ domain-containing protein [Elizabethkingia anophelis]MCT4021335.1 PDZ domain-containing protein [Elizabethkingia anophelis]